MRGAAWVGMAYRSGLELYDRLVLVLEDLDTLDFHDLLEFLL